MDLRGKRVVITGAGSGIGRALLDALGHFDNIRILAVDLNTDSIPDTLHIQRFACDISTAENNDLLFDYAKEKLGGIDVFIANAGFAYYEQLSGSDWSRIERIYQVNVFAPVYCAIKMHDLYPEHVMVMTASAMSHMAVPGYAIYGSTKAALDRFAEAYRLEPDKRGHLMLVYPVATRTNFFRTSHHKPAPTPFPSQTPEEVARAVVKGLQQNKKAVYPSSVFRVALWLDRIMPFTRRVVQSVYLRQFVTWLTD